MATPNYNYEKRQRELAKKKKKEEKLKERESRKVEGDAINTPSGSASGAEMSASLTPPETKSNTSI
jgi:hypothetical protein